jgi:hypothetical protein
MIKVDFDIGLAPLASNIHLCVPDEQKENFNDANQDKNTRGWRRPAGDPTG